MSQRGNNAASPPRGAPDAKRLAGGRGWAVLMGAIVVLAGLGAVLVPVWRRHVLVARIATSLPALPDISTLPTVLQERLRTAQDRAQSPASTLGGVAELGRLYDANGFDHRARTCWRLLQAAEPDDAHWCYYLADLQRTAGDYAGAIALFAQAAKLAPDYAPVWLSLGDLELKSGRYDAAARDYQRRLVLLPGDPYARLGLTRVALMQGQRDRARTLLARLVQDTPDFPPPHNLYAEMLAADGDKAGAAKQRWLGHETGRFREASDPWLDELMGWCFNYDRLCIRGTVDYQTKFGDRGKSCFERAIKLRPEVLTAYDLLGSLYLELNQPAKARDIYEEGLQRATSAKPTVMYYVNLSRAYREMKQPTEAVRVARLGLARTGDAFELYDALGVALGDLGQHEAAVKALQAAVAGNPNDANANYNLAVALIAVRRLGAAVAALHQSLTLKPTFPDSLALLAQIEMDSGRWESAAKYLQPLYDSHPAMPQARAMMAYWHLRAGLAAQTQGDPATAERHFRAGLAIAPNDVELQASLGALYLTQQRFADAIAPLEAYHRLKPDDPQSALFLGQAYAATGRREEARQMLTEGVRLAVKAGNQTTARDCREILDQL